VRPDLASGGNAAGIGGADLMIRSMHDKIDWDVTYTNSLTSGGTAGSRMPEVLDHAEDSSESRWPPSVSTTSSRPG
jgi:hypothetical protein